MTNPAQHPRVSPQRQPELLRIDIPHGQTRLGGVHALPEVGDDLAEISVASVEIEEHVVRY